MSGGGASNVVMDKLEFSGECRSHNPEFRDLILNTIQAYFKNAAMQIRNKDGDRAKVSFQIRNQYPPFRISDDDPFVQNVKSAMEEMNLNPQTIVCDGGMDANFISQQLNLPVVTIGAGAHQIHTVNEILNLTEYYQCCDFLIRFVSRNQSQDT